jgi:hypothetical protein
MGGTTLLQAGPAHPFTATRYRSSESATGRTGRHMDSDVFPYAVAAALAVAIALGLWLFGVWFGG